MKDRKLAKLSRDLEASLDVFSEFCWGKRKGELAFPSASVKRIEMGVTLCGKSKIKSLNRNYRGKDKVTDVLSFPVYEDLRQGSEERNFLMPEIDLGDVIICREKIYQQARDFDLPPLAEALHLVAHGFLHLCGHDHERSEKEEKQMQELEDRIVAALYKRVGY